MEERVLGFHHPHIDMFDALWKEVPKDPSMIDSPATASVTPPPHKPQPAPMDPEFMEIFKAMQAELKELRLTVSNHSVCNSLNEVNQCQAMLTLKEMEQRYCMREFNQPMAKYHTMNVFDFKYSMKDLVALAELVVVSLKCRWMSTPQSL